MSRFTELSTVLQSLIRVQEEATEDEDIVLVSDDEVSEDEDLTSGGEDPALVKSRPPAACFYCTDGFRWRSLQGRHCMHRVPKQLCFGKRPW